MLFRNHNRPMSCADRLRYVFQIDRKQARRLREYARSYEQFDDGLYADDWQREEDFRHE